MGQSSFESISYVLKRVRVLPCDVHDIRDLRDPHDMLDESDMRDFCDGGG